MYNGWEGFSQCDNVATHESGHSFGMVRGGIHKKNLGRREPGPVVR